MVVGDRPYPPEAVAAALDLPLAGSIAWDPRGAAGCWAKGATAAGVRSSLARSATRVLGGLESVSRPASRPGSRRPSSRCRPRRPRRPARRRPAPSAPADGGRRRP